MGQLQKFKCCKCGHEEWAPDNKTGRYALMSGTVQMFLCKTHHNIARILISSGYFGDDDDVNDVEANRLIAEVIERGEVDYSPGLTIPPLKEKRSVRHNLEPWNVVTGKCPRCGGDMEQDGFICMMVD